MDAVGRWGMVRDGQISWASIEVWKQVEGTFWMKCVLPEERKF
jgi:hypothetical protein